MATNDKFIQSIIELLDRLIEHQSKSSNVLTEIRLSNTELRNDLTEAMRHLREKLPETIIDTSEESHKKLLYIIQNLEDHNIELNKQIVDFGNDKVEMDFIIKTNTSDLSQAKNLLETIRFSLADSLKENQKHKEEMTIIIKEIHDFIGTLKSKKAWAAIIAGGLVGLATLITAINQGIEALFPPQTTAQTSNKTATPTPPTNPSTQPTKP